MKRTSGSQRKGTFLHSRFWRCVFLAGLLASMLALLPELSAATSSPVFAAALLPSLNTFAVSPTQGPVGAVISVSGNGVAFPAGTQVNLGYTIDYKTCNLVSGGQSGVVQNSNFSGWFRWPTSTPVGTFGVCAIASGLTFQIGSYQVLSASVPHIAVAPTRLNAGQQATVSGANFLPAGTSVNLVWRSANGGHTVSFGTVSSNQTGAFVHTFIVPAHVSTGSYTLTSSVGSGSPPTLSAATTFHVEGVTLVAVPTPTAAPKPTAVPTVATVVPTSAPTSVTSQIVPAHQSTSTNGGDSGNRAGLFVPIALGGGLLIVLALGAGVLIVRRQRRLLSATPGSNSGSLLWPETTDMIARGANASVGASTARPAPMYPGGNALSGNPGREYLPAPEAPTLHSEVTTLPFDPGLAEAMREAQVSLFATPRPPASADVEIQ